MRKVHFYVNANKPRGSAVRELLAADARRLGMAEAAAFDADVVIALGGDGTILRAVHEFPGVPVLGLNIGGLGYLSCVGANDFSSAIARLAEGRYRISERTMLELRGERAIRALNDIVLIREMSGHVARLDLTVDGRSATQYLGDGLVLATPTGSTAYSLAAGGPVLMSDSRSFVVTPVNPHALGIRPIVVSDQSTFAVTSIPRMSGCVERIGVYADGDSVALLEAGATIEIAKAAQGAALVELEGYDPYAVLARKLGWSAGAGGGRP